MHDDPPIHLEPPDALDALGLGELDLELTGGLDAADLELDDSGAARGAADRQRSERYLDALFGPGAGARHAAFIDRLEHPVLRDTLHGYHVLEADTRYLSVAENYLLGMTVLCAQRNYGPAAMFAKTLIHIGVPRGKLLEAIARLTMWVGGIVAAEAAAHIQKAIGEYEQHGLVSLAAWFPPVRTSDTGDAP